MMTGMHKLKGFTLLEVLLVLVIVTSILLMMTNYMTTKTDESKRDFTAIQYEQLLNAGLAYYVSFGSWPSDDTTLKAKNYIPNKTINNAWRGGYKFFSNPTTGVFSICSLVPQIEAGILAGRLPLAYIANDCTASGSSPPALVTSCTNVSCGVVAGVNIPGQNLNNARSLNFASLYHNGGCVPAPVCPNPYSASNNSGMKPAIMVVPVSVSGNYYGTDVFPLSSFTAYAVGDGTSNDNPTKQPVACTDNTQTPPCDFGGGLSSPAQLYWRVCLDVVTEKGRIKAPYWNKESGTIMAITRCVPNNEPVGSGFDVFLPN